MIVMHDRGNSACSRVLHKPQTACWRDGSISSSRRDEKERLVRGASQAWREVIEEASDVCFLLEREEE